MKTLVTGGAGFIGSALTRALLERGHEVIVIDNLMMGRRDAVPSEAQLVELDLREPDGLSEVCAGVDTVFHQAALRSVPKSVDDPALCNACNVTGTLNILQAASQAGCRRLVYASSSSVYGDVSGTVNVETLPTNPLSPYAVSKLAGEHYCRVWAALGRISTVCLRYFNVFGPGQHPDSKYGAVFPGFIAALRAGRPPEIHWDGEQARDFTFVDDVIAANLAASETTDERADGAVFNIASARPRSVNEVLRRVSDAVGVWIEPKRLPKRPGDIRSSHGDISKARDVLGWEPRADWVHAVDLTVKSFGVPPTV